MFPHNQTPYVVLYLKRLIDYLERDGGDVELLSKLKNNFQFINIYMDLRDKIGTSAHYTALHCIVQAPREYFTETFKHLHNKAESNGRSFKYKVQEPQWLYTMEAVQHMRGFPELYNNEILTMLHFLHWMLFSPSSGYVLYTFDARFDPALEELFNVLGYRDLADAIRDDSAVNVCISTEEIIALNPKAG